MLLIAGILCFGKQMPELSSKPMLVFAQTLVDLTVYASGISSRHEIIQPSALHLNDKVAQPYLSQALLSIPEISGFVELSLIHI